MSVIEALIAGVIFGSAGAGALHMQARSLEVLAGEEQRLRVEAAGERGLQRLQRALEARAGQSAPAAAGEASDCGGVAAALAQELAASALLDGQAGAGAQLELAAEGELLRAKLRLPDLPERQRWYSPAAYGLCADVRPGTVAPEEAR
jgi:hypothetical protein